MDLGLNFICQLFVLENSKLLGALNLSNVGLSKLSDFELGSSFFSDSTFILVILAHALVRMSDVASQRLRLYEGFAAKRARKWTSNLRDFLAALINGRNLATANIDMLRKAF